MNLSYWENQHFFSNVGYCIAGGGIVGLNAALHLRKRNPTAKILVVEKSLTGAAASSKNAGFACFGSVSEILDDIGSAGEDAAAALIRMRWDGLQLMLETLGEKTIDFQRNGGFELFTDKDHELYEKCAHALPLLNEMTAFTGSKVYSLSERSFGFHGVKHIIENSREGQIDTALMYFSLEQMALRENIIILRGYEVSHFQDGSTVKIVLNNGFEFSATRLLITTNGFARQLIPEADVQPARAQVLVTAPIAGLNLKGTFHYDRGYYYFRNIGDRILIGGGRNSDFASENTGSQEITAGIQQRIERLLFETVLGREVEIESRWAGTMGVGTIKKPILQPLGQNVFCGVRMGGMGVAIGSLVGRELAEMTVDS